MIVGIIDCLEDVVGQRLRDVDPNDFGTHLRAQGSNFHHVFPFFLQAGLTSYLSE